jgi:hypothetical protein
VRLRIARTFQIGTRSLAKQAGPVVFEIPVTLTVLLAAGAASLLGRVTRPINAWTCRS